MKTILKIITFCILILLFFQCSKNDNGVQNPPNEPTITDKITTVQNTGDNLLISLLAVKDTASALDSVLKVFLKDTTVLSGSVTSQGITIKYKNGIIGGILINPEDGLPLEQNSLYKTPLIPADINSYSPTSKKTIFINPSYEERQSYANGIINLYNSIFPRIGYNPPTTVLGNAATIEVMTNLSGYGIIHIYSHGWAYPDKYHIYEIYLMTGEDVNATTNKKYEDELLSGNIPIIKVHQGSTKYFLSSTFFSDKNNFSKDSTLFYGGFCFSFRGGWSNAMLDVSKAGSYTGFTWRVLTSWNASLSHSLMDTLSNNSLDSPRTLDYWFTKTPNIAKQLYDPTDKVYCKIQYVGHSDLTLWSALEINISPNPATSKPKESITFTSEANNKLPTQFKYIWNFGDQTGDITVNNDSVKTHTFANVGTYNITVKLYNQTNKLITQASSQAIITSSTGCPATISYAGKTYNVVKIGTQCWLKENLDVGTRINGTVDQDNNSQIEKYCYDNNPANCTTYGGLYQWDEAMQYSTASGAQGICPQDWHIPTKAEFEAFAAAVSNDGNALKATGQGTGDGAGTNTSGFSAYLAGSRFFSDGKYYSLNDLAYFWSSTNYSTIYAYILFLSSTTKNIETASYQDGDWGFSVRCVKN
ncbi:MAG: FISUMP domain-containing protein [bacterium]